MGKDTGKKISKKLNVKYSQKPIRHAEECYRCI